MAPRREKVKAPGGMRPILSQSADRRERNRSAYPVMRRSGSIPKQKSETPRPNESDGASRGSSSSQALPGVAAANRRDQPASMKLELGLVSATAGRFGRGAGGFAAARIAAAAVAATMTEAAETATDVREEIANRGRTAAATAAVVAARRSAAGRGSAASGLATGRRGTASRFGRGTGGFTAARLAATAAEHTIQQTGLQISRHGEHGRHGKQGHIHTRLHGEDSCSCWETNSADGISRLQLCEISARSKPRLSIAL